MPTNFNKMVEPPSKDSEPVKVRFYNCYGKAVQVKWVSYDGHYTPNKVLQPGQFVDVDTYTKHVWVFEEVGTSIRLMANNKPYFCFIEDDSYCCKILAGRRYVVRVSKADPLKLSRLCIKQICRYLRHSADVEFLEIPAILKKDIKKQMQL